MAHNGCVLIQAPTGAGKTLMAGLVAEQFSREAKVVWFWFTPFAGLVEQARIAMKNTCGCDNADISRLTGLSMGSKRDAFA